MVLKILLMERLLMQKLKSKNKLTYNFENGQSIQINPSDIGEKIIYNSSPFSFFEIKKDYISYGIHVDF